MRKPHIIITLSIIVLITVFFARTTTAQELSARTDRQSIELGETMSLTISYNGDAEGQNPDFNLIRENFTIQSLYPSYQKTIVGGRTTYTNSWELILEPKLQGTLLIPPISFKGLHTDTISITVNTPNNKSLENKDILLETIVDKSSAYVQEQITVTYRLYYSVQIEVEPEALSLNDAIIKELEAKQYQRRVDGKMYRVVEVPYTIVPQRSGTLVIPQTTWQIRVATAGNNSSFNRFGRYELRKFRSQEKIIRIKPIPDTFPKGATWLPASKLDATETWSHNTNDLKLGEPVTRHIEVTGIGVEAAQIPEIMTQNIDAQFKLYIEPAQLDDAVNELGLLGTRTETAALVLESEGTVSTGEISIPWWNTQDDKLEQLVFPARELIVKNGTSNPNHLQTQNNISATLDREPTPDLIKESAPNAGIFNQLTIGLILSNTASLLFIIWLLRKRKVFSKDTSNTKKKNMARKSPSKYTELRRLIKEYDIEGIYTLLSGITKERFGLSSYAALIEHADSAGQAELKNSLTAIERMLYARSEAHSPDETNTNTAKLELNNLVSQIQKLEQSIHVTKVNDTILSPI